MQVHYGSRSVGHCMSHNNYIMHAYCMQIVCIANECTNNATVSNHYGWTIYDDSTVREVEEKVWAMSDTVKYDIID